MKKAHAFHETGGTGHSRESEITDAGEHVLGTQNDSHTNLRKPLVNYADDAGSQTDLGKPIGYWDEADSQTDLSKPFSVDDAGSQTDLSKPFSYSDDSGSQTDLGEQHISQMQIVDKKKARCIAEYVLEVLEEDLFNYFNIEGHQYGDAEKRLKGHLHQMSTMSLASNYSEPRFGEPSTMNLYYEGDGSTVALPKSSEQSIHMAGEGTQAEIHRKYPCKYRDAFTLSRDMAFLNPVKAEVVFRHNYPLKDDYKAPKIPSRAASLASVLEKAKEESQDVNKIGPKIKIGKKAKLLPPLPKDYFKEETFWTGSVFRGEYVDRQFQHGRFEYPLMSTYESEFKDGHAHTQKHLGVVTYPRGDKFEGEWVEGRHVSGKITFADDLKYEQENWDYCASPDRRFYIEKDIGVKPAGRTLFNDRFPIPYIPPGRYDTGYGVFNPKTGVLKGYGGEKIRNASYEECKWIMSFCRKVKKCEDIYKPVFDVSRFPGSSVEKFVKQ